MTEAGPMVGRAEAARRSLRELPEVAPGSGVQPLPGARQVQLAAKVTIGVFGVGLLAVAVHVVRTARTVLRR